MWRDIVAWAWDAGYGAHGRSRAPRQTPAMAVSARV